MRLPGAILAPLRAKRDRQRLDAPTQVFTGPYQRLAGASLCVVEILVFAIAFVVVFINLLSRSEARMALVEGAAGHPGEQF